MGLRAYGNKRDTAEAEVIAALEQLGASVVRMDKPVDLLIGFRGHDYIAEVKTGTKGYGKAMNGSQALFAAEWRGSKFPVLRSAQDAIDFICSISKRAAA